MRELSDGKARWTKPGLRHSRTEALEAVPSPSVVRGPDGRFAPGTARPPRRRGGGQAKNMNHARDAAGLFWRRRVLHPKWRWVLQACPRDPYLGGIHSDKGGARELSEAEKRVAEQA